MRIEGESGDEVDHYFNALLARRDELDETFGPGLLWDPLEGSRLAESWRRYGGCDEETRQFDTQDRA